MPNSVLFICHQISHYRQLCHYELPRLCENQWRCNNFSLVRVCVLVFWLGTWGPLLTACGRVRIKKLLFPTGWCFTVAAEMLCISRGPEWRFSPGCWPMLQIFAEEEVILALLQALEDTTYKIWLGGQSQRWQGLWLDWKRNCANTSDFIVLAAK